MLKSTLRILGAMSLIPIAQAAVSINIDYGSHSDDQVVPYLDYAVSQWTKALANATTLTGGDMTYNFSLVDVIPFHSAHVVIMSRDFSESYASIGLVATSGPLLSLPDGPIMEYTLDDVVIGRVRTVEPNSYYDMNTQALRIIGFSLLTDKNRGSFTYNGMDFVTSSGYISDPRAHASIDGYNYPLGVMSKFDTGGRQELSELDIAFVASGAGLTGTLNYNPSASAIPEPSTYGLMGASALAGVAVLRRRKRSV